MQSQNRNRTRSYVFCGLCEWQIGEGFRGGEFRNRNMYRISWLKARILNRSSWCSNLVRIGRVSGLEIHFDRLRLGTESRKWGLGKLWEQVKPFVIMGHWWLLGRPDFWSIWCSLFLASLGHKQANLKRKRPNSVKKWSGMAVENFFVYGGSSQRNFFQRTFQITFWLNWAFSSSSLLAYNLMRPKNSEHQIDWKLGRPSVYFLLLLQLICQICQVDECIT